MARSPFQGTWQQSARPTVVTAPDAIVYINGESETPACSECHRRMDINKYVTSVQVDLSVDSAPGSASISLSVPRHEIDGFYFDGNPTLSAMMEVEIYAKGFYLVEGVPQYYPIFWGLITEVSESYSGGEHTISIHCADILKWWELCTMNINPAFTAPNGQLGRSIFGNVMFGTNPYDVIWTLAQQSFGDVMVGTGSLVSLAKEQGAQKPVFNAALSDIMVYWAERFSRVRSNLLLYGTNGVAVRGDTLYEEYRRNNRSPGHLASSAVRKANGGADSGQMTFDPTSSEVTAFRTQFGQAGQVNFWQAEFQTKLELANTAKEAIGFEFYMDVTGDIVFKPPFYNLDVISNKPLSWVQDIDVIDWNFSDSESEVVTQLVIQGNYGGNTDYGLPEEATPYTTVTDYHLLRKYGWRQRPLNSEFMGSPEQMFQHGLDTLDRMNATRHRGSVTIPFRPELRLGFPIYLAPKDQIWYVSGISHNLAFGGRATTTLTLTSRRSKFIAPQGIGSIQLSSFKGTKDPTQTFYTSQELAKYGSFNLKVGDAAETPPINVPENAATGPNPYDPLILRHPKTGRVLGYPNATMVYTRPFTDTSADQLRKVAGQRTTPHPHVEEDTQKKIQTASLQLDKSLQDRFTVGPDGRLKAKYLTNRYQYGLTSAGVYVYAHDVSKVIGELLLIPTSKVTEDSATNQKSLPGGTGMIRPVSDERGFEVIGHYRYGRGVSLRDGSLVLSKNAEGLAVNQVANIDPQLALSGDMIGMLNAQSQGLTTTTSQYANSADAVARLLPEDLQTAGVINPETGAPEFENIGTTFVDAAPLGSPEAKGFFNSVEASQLSRALTIAELTIKEGQRGESVDCVCLSGRTDLAFISTGYQVRAVNPTSASPDTLDALFSSSSESFDAAVGLVRPERPDWSQVQPKVTRFLQNLYTALDAPHQAHEDALRGTKLPRGTFDENPNQVRFGVPPDPYGETSPPFSAPGRYAVGDPVAAAQQADSAAKDLTRSWKSFGDQARENARVARSTKVPYAQGASTREGLSARTPGRPPEGES